MRRTTLGPLFHHDHNWWQESLKALHAIGDCSTVYNLWLLWRTCSSTTVKVNQIGTVTEAIEVVKMAKDAQWGVVISQRLGETEDSFISDLSVGLATSQIKAGAPCRGERLAKYNQLLRIEEELGDQAVYTGEKWRN
uniref:phosphopyruvate hydratase n=1 Tax=Solanum lycopersicum TaxID=4081 RepID=A0A3Q7HXE6_SOLLC